jgi:hypothetical protein
VNEGGCDDDTGTKIFCKSGRKKTMRKEEVEGGGGAYSKTLWGRVTRLDRWAMMGKVEPKVLQTQMMKTDAMRRPV